MIIWLDGTYGVGKSTIARELESLLNGNDVKILNSDKYYNEMIHKNPFSALGTGILPQNNINFIDFFKQIIEKNLHNEKEIIIVDMSLTQKECKEYLFDYFISKSIKILHVILTANQETLYKRIEEYPNRDDIATLYMDENIKFLNSNFKDAIRVDTENKIASEVAKEIISYIK